MNGRYSCLANAVFLLMIVVITAIMVQVPILLLIGIFILVGLYIMKRGEVYLSNDAIYFSDFQ